ncbi:hypothetical protein KY334_03890 [Candidatus Woesearchaeota archaeon]|nr:hypothetical protein [Candidatus Woesearchaeota archaeon]
MNEKCYELAEKGLELSKKYNDILKQSRDTLVGKENLCDLEHILSFELCFEGNIYDLHLIKESLNSNHDETLKDYLLNSFNEDKVKFGMDLCCLGKKTKEHLDFNSYGLMNLLDKYKLDQNKEILDELTYTEESLKYQIEKAKKMLPYVTELMNKA